MNGILWLWTILSSFSAFLSKPTSDFSHFDIAISFSHQASKLSTSVFNLSATNYSLGSFPRRLLSENGQQIYEGDLLQIKGFVKVDNESRKNGTCFIQKFHPPARSPWIAVIIEERSTHLQTQQHHHVCPSVALLTYTISSTNVSVILFFHNQESPFNLAASKYDSHHQVLKQLLRSREVVFISLALDMFTDLPNQLLAASQQTKVSGVIQFFSQPRMADKSNEEVGNFISEAGKKAISSGLLLILVILFLIFMLFCLARLSFCFCQRFCLAQSKSNRSRKLTAATKKALKQLPVKHLQLVDPLLSSGGLDQCAICIELFKPHDIIRSLPCRHLYHKACIDPWLLKHRSCPLCKQNILIACGIVLEDGLSATTSDDSENSSQQLSSSDSGTSDFTMRSRFTANGCASCNQRRYRNNQSPSSLFCFGRRRRANHHHDYRYSRRSEEMGEAALELGEGHWYPLRGLASLSETSPSGDSSPIRQQRSPPQNMYQAARSRFSSSLSLSPSYSASSKQNLNNQQFLCCLPWCSVWYAAPVEKHGLSSLQHPRTVSCPMPQGYPAVYLQPMHNNHNNPHSCIQYHPGAGSERLAYQLPLNQVESKGGFMKIPLAGACYPTGIGHLGFHYPSVAVKVASPPCSILPMSCVFPKQPNGGALPSYEQVAAGANAPRNMLLPSVVNSKSAEETNRTRLCLDQTGSKTKVVYAVLSASTSRIHDGSTYLPGCQFTSICSTSVATPSSSQLPVFVDVNVDVNAAQRNPNFFSSPELRSLPDTEQDGEGGLQRNTPDVFLAVGAQEQLSASMVKLNYLSAELPPPPAYSQTALLSPSEVEERHCLQSYQTVSLAPVHPIRKAAQLICQALTSTNGLRRTDNHMKQRTTATLYDAIKSPCDGEKAKSHHSTFASSKLCTYFPLHCLRATPKHQLTKQRYIPVRERIRIRRIGGEYSYPQRLGKTLVLEPNGLIRQEGAGGDLSSSKSSSVSSSYFTRRYLSERREHARMRSVKVTVEPQENPCPYERPLQLEEDIGFKEAGEELNELPSRPHSLPNTLPSLSFSVLAQTPHIIGSSAPALLTFPSSLTADF